MGRKVSRTDLVMADSTCAIGGKNPDGLEKITDGFDDGQSISTNPEHTQLARVSDDR